MKLRVLAGALALLVGGSVLAPAAAEAGDRDRRDRHRGGRVTVTRSYRYDRPRAYRSSRNYRPYRYDNRYDNRYTNRYRNYGYGYRGYSDYYYDDYYYGGYYPTYGYGPRVVVWPSYRYGYRYRPLLGVRLGGPRFGVWLGW